MRNDVHSGMIVASKNYGKSAVIYWGDSLSMRPPTNITKYASILFQTLTNNITWEIDYKMNWVLHHDDYEKQKDSHMLLCFIIHETSR